MMVAIVMLLGAVAIIAVALENSWVPLALVAGIGIALRFF